MLSRITRRRFLTAAVVTGGVLALGTQTLARPGERAVPAAMAVPWWAPEPPAVPAAGSAAASAAASARASAIAEPPPADPPAPDTLPAPAPVPAPGSAPSPAPSPGRAPAGAPPTGYPFGAMSVWRTEITSAPVAAGSSGLVSRLAANVAAHSGGTAAFNAHAYGNSIVVAPAGTPPVDVGFDNCQHKTHVPAGLTGPGGQFTGVPIPAGATPARGSDQMLSVYSPSSDQLWEFWVASRDDSGHWSACFGGRIDGVSRSLGYFLHGFGATATGLSDTGGTVTVEDVRSGHIDHAIALVVPNAADRTRYSWPAQRSDGDNTDPDAVPEGTRLRLDPTLDVAALGLGPVGAMIARAAQRYGFIVTDQGGNVAVVADSGAAEAARTGQDPWDQVLGGADTSSVLRGFPWDRLQALPQNFGRPPGA